MIGEQQQPQQTYQTQPIHYDTNKIMTSSTNTVPATKTNGFANTNTLYQQQQQQIQQQQYPQQQQHQQIDKATGLPVPVPAPRRSNSIPLGDGPEPTSASTSSDLTTVTSPTTSTQNGTLPQHHPLTGSAATASTSTSSSQPTTATTGTTTDSTETQVGFIISQKRFVFVCLNSFFSLMLSFKKLHAFYVYVFLFCESQNLYSQNKQTNKKIL